MSEKTIDIQDIVKPARLTDDKTGQVYVLDFSRESIVFAERNKFKLEDAIEYPVTGMRDLFYYAFRKNHRNISREKTDKLIEKWGGGIPEELVKRLIQLYQQALASNSIVVDEDAAKNSGLTLDPLQLQSHLKNCSCVTVRIISLSV